MAKQPQSRKPLRITVEASSAAATTNRLEGRVLCGKAEAGDNIVFSPSNQKAKIKSVDQAGASVVLILDREVLLAEPALISHEDNLPVETDVFHVDLANGAPAGLSVGSAAEVELAIGRILVTVEAVDGGANPEASEGHSILVRADHVVALDPFDKLPDRAQAKIFVDGVKVADGVVGMKGYADQRELRTVRATNVTRVSHAISTGDRVARNGHRGGVLWLTGFSGSGKSTLAVALEAALFEQGLQVYVLDGDNVRHGLNANLGFSPEDRSENIRRVGEVAALFARAGFIVVSAFISPYQSDRARARAAAEDGDFHEIFLSTSLKVCEDRDPKGLYERARAGEIPDFTGISAPYEVPKKPELVIDTGELGVEDCVSMMTDYVERMFVTNREGAAAR